MANELIPITKVIKRFREQYYSGQKVPESLDILCKHLSNTTNCNLFL